jgi:hypothetical protein
MNTKISVVIPTYNGAKDLSKQIKTLINDIQKLELGREKIDIDREKMIKHFKKSVKS